MEDVCWVYFAGHDFNPGFDKHMATGKGFALAVRHRPARLRRRSGARHRERTLSSHTLLVAAIGTGGSRASYLFLVATVGRGLRPVFMVIDGLAVPSSSAVLCGAKLTLAQAAYGFAKAAASSAIAGFGGSYLSGAPTAAAIVLESSAVLGYHQRNYGFALGQRPPQVIASFAKAAFVFIRR